MKGYSAFLKPPAIMEPHHQIVQYHIQDSRWVGVLAPLQRSSQCILQSQPTGQSDCLVLYPGHSLGGSYPSAEQQSVYSIVPVDWAIRLFSVINRTLVGGSLLSAEKQSVYSIVTVDWAIRLFSVICRTLVWVGSLLSAEKQSVYSIVPADWAIRLFSVISRTLVRAFLSLYKEAVGGQSIVRYPSSLKNVLIIHKKMVDSFCPYNREIQVDIFRRRIKCDMNLFALFDCQRIDCWFFPTRLRYHQKMLKWIIKDRQKNFLDSGIANS